ncbi:MAG TPA: hypothetical protein EYN91_21560 [Candidatus Melainabacteria bacterium]|nr:hypothetical protein [Candidatus Melainabacteria bacterium]
MFSIETFSLQDMTDLSAEIRELGSGARTQESVADRIVKHLYEGFTLKKSGDKAFALARFFISLPFRELEQPLKRFVESRRSEPHDIRPDTRCLTLLATYGERAEWCDRTKSTDHRAIPIDSPDLATELPMIALLCKQFGFESNTVSDVVLSNPERQPQSLATADSDVVMDQDQATFNVFFVQEALESPYIYAQEEFVKPYGIRSVLGYGGILSAGQIFAVILFSRASIKREVAQRFKPLALSTKNALLQVPQDKVFDLL